MNRICSFIFVFFLFPVFAWAEGGDVVITKTLEATGEMMAAKAVYLRAEDVDTFGEVSINDWTEGTTISGGQAM